MEEDGIKLKIQRLSGDKRLGTNQRARYGVEVAAGMVAGLARSVIVDLVKVI